MSGAESVGEDLTTSSAAPKSSAQAPARDGTSIQRPGSLAGSIAEGRKTVGSGRTVGRIEEPAASSRSGGGSSGGAAQSGARSTADQVAAIRKRREEQEKQARDQREQTRRAREKQQRDQQQKRERDRRAALSRLAERRRKPSAGTSKDGRFSLRPEGKTVDARIRSLMRDPRYWRDRDPGLQDHVKTQWEKAYPGTTGSTAFGRDGPEPQPAIRPEEVEPWHGANPEAVTTDIETEEANPTDEPEKPREQVAFLPAAAAAAGAAGLSAGEAAALLGLTGAAGALGLYGSGVIGGEEDSADDTGNDNAPGDTGILENRKAKDSSKNEKHGDGGRTRSKAQKQIEGYRDALKKAKSRREKKDLKKKMKNVTEDSARKAKGEEHGRRGKSKGNKQ